MRSRHRQFVSILCAGLLLGACSANPEIADGGADDGAIARMDGTVNIDRTIPRDVPPGVDIPNPLDVPPGVDSPNPLDVPPGVDSPNPVDVPPGADVPSVMGDVPNGPCRPVSCAGRPLECGDCIDNDGDGRVDDRDPECLGPCDNTEGPVLLAGVGGEAGGPCMSDCYFDFGNGSGNDDCYWDHRCDPLSVGPSFPPEGMACAFDRSRVGGRTCPANQSQQCLNFCRPITPNGCDCFGCCTFPQIRGRSAAMGGEFVWLGSRDDRGNGSCTLAQVTNTAACHSCTPVADCFNDCGVCEVCIGRPMPPPECFPPPPNPVDGGMSVDSGMRIDGGMSIDGGAIIRPDSGIPASQCPPGIQACGLPGQGPCPVNFYCTTGCCIPIPG